MDIKAVEKAVSKIQSQLFKRSNSHSIGTLKSQFRGTGLQFKEHRVYTHGDEVRFIDWKLLAKTSLPYVKIFEEERNVEITVVIDASPTMFMGHEGVSKFQAAIEICCLLYLLSKQTGDFVHCLIFADEVWSIPPKNGKEGITYLVSLLEDKGLLTPQGAVNMSYAAKSLSTDKRKEERIRTILKHLLRRREIVLLSDFNDFFDVQEYKRIFFRSNVNAFQVLCPLDETEKLPYSVFATLPNQRSVNTRINFQNQRKKESFFHKIRPIRVQDRYLENFIEELL